MLKIYQTDRDGYYVGPSYADESPLEPGRYLLPAYAYTEPPPQAVANKVIRRVGKVWTQVDDFRGTKYWLADGTEHEITELGVTIPPEALFEKPKPPLAVVKAEKMSDINALRQLANQSYFNHAGKQIACDPLSRSDIDGINGYVATRNSLPPGWYGGWKAIDNTYVPITNTAQWYAFYESMILQGQANFAHSQQLKAEVLAATTHEQVEAINW
jgi:hypothetical protein